MNKKQRFGVEKNIDKKVKHNYKTELLLTAILILLILPVFLTQLINAEESLSLSGYFLTDHRVSMHKPYDLSFQEYRLDIKTIAASTNRLKFEAQTWVRTFGIVQLQHFSDVLNSSRIIPTELNMRQAFFDIYEFPLKNMDVRIGRQLLGWGSADRFNPTNNLCAPDLEDIWDFGRRLALDGLQVSCYSGIFTFKGVVSSNFRPAVLPRGHLISMLIDQQKPLVQGVNLVVLDTIIRQLEARPSESVSAALRAEVKFGGYDFAASYEYCRETFPLEFMRRYPRTVFVNNTLFPDTIYVISELAYPRIQVVGLDISGSIRDIGVWVEGAMFFPQRIEGKIDTSGSGLGPLLQLAPQLTTQLAPSGCGDTPYLKVVAGVDYSFASNVYVNIQYCRGFIHQRADNIDDFFVGTLSWDLFNKKLTLEPGAIGVEIKKWSSVEKNYGLVFQSQVSIQPIDNVQLVGGVRLISGAQNTIFGSASKRDEGYLRMKCSF